VAAAGAAVAAVQAQVVLAEEMSNVVPEAEEREAVEGVVGAHHPRPLARKPEPYTLNPKPKRLQGLNSKP
jgi:hypothetical protein